MAFNNLQPASGPFFLAPGASIRVRVWFGDPGEDRGAQWIMAHPIRGEPPTELVVSECAKRLDYQIGITRVNGSAEYDYDPDSFYYEYRVTVTNRGPEGVRFSVQGGGNT